MNIIPPFLRRFSRAPDVTHSASPSDAQVPAFSAATGVFTFSTPSSGGSPGGSTTQIQFNSSGSFAGDANLTWDGVNKQLIITGPVGGGTILDVLQSDASGLFHVADVGGPGAYVVFGDTTFSHNKCAVFVDDTGPSVAMCCPNGSVSVGDVYSYGNDSLLAVDDANQKATLNVDLEFTLDTKGVVLIGRNDGTTKVRLFYDSGAGGLQVEAV